jgi:thiol-disulfide isomerase/thioredoxin
VKGLTLRLKFFAAVYMGFALTSNPVLADQAALEALREGTMQKLMFTEPVVVPDVAVTDLSGVAHHLSDYKGKVVVVNFWATWCAPCRAEMPSLDALNKELGGEDFIVVPVATGRNEPAGITRFFAETGVESLEVLLDPKMELAHQMGVMGLPVTVILNREGEEIARLIGDADWASESALSIIKALIAAP